MVSKIRKKKRRKTNHSKSDSEEESASKSNRKRKQKKSGNKNSLFLNKIDEILASENHEQKLDARVVSKIDKIIFSDISTSSKKRKKKRVLNEVDKILGLECRTDNDGSEESYYTDSDSDELTEFEMRLLNLIKVKKIDMKTNFTSVYPDVLCHFCRYLPF